jgi:hypothetical protein
MVVVVIEVVATVVVVTEAVADMVEEIVTNNILIQHKKSLRLF